MIAIPIARGSSIDVSSGVPFAFVADPPNPAHPVPLCFGVLAGPRAMVRDASTDSTWWRLE